MKTLIEFVLFGLLTQSTVGKDELGVSKVSASGEIAHSLLHLLAGGHVQVNEYQPTFTALSWRGRARDNKINRRKGNNHINVLDRISANMDDLTSSTIVDHNSPDKTQRKAIEDPLDNIGFVEETGESNFVTEPPRKSRSRFRTPRRPKPITTTTTTTVKPTTQMTLIPLFPTFAPLFPSMTQPPMLGSLFPGFNLPSNPFTFPTTTNTPVSSSTTERTVATLPPFTTATPKPFGLFVTTATPIKQTTIMSVGIVFKKGDKDDEDDRTPDPTTEDTTETTETTKLKTRQPKTQSPVEQSTTFRPDEKMNQTTNSDEPPESSTQSTSKVDSSGSGSELGETEVPGKCGDGRWSEWKVVTPCSAECGACGLIKRERECLSFKNGKGCPCTGDYKEIQPCKIGVCSFPRPSCCPPYNLIYIDKKFACGPQSQSVLTQFQKESKDGD
ncbi:hypothetical protein M3Y98_00477500 [Aphelenchoides besseyi]|nr:hypothetical protein M3Y98_00477500 [Aphelenchoides besseyi]